MASYSYEYDPATGNVYLVAGDARQLYEGEISDLLNGGFTLEGNQLVDVNNPFIRDQLGSGAISITRTGYSSGATVVRVASGITPGTLNAPSQRLAAYNVSGDVTVMDQSGAEHSISIEASGVTGYGQRLLYYEGVTGTKNWESVTQGDDREAYIREIYGDTVRWATANEYADTAVIGYLKRHWEREIEDIVRSGGIENEYGGLEDTFSGVIRALARMNRESLTYTKVVTINQHGEIGSLYAA